MKTLTKIIILLIVSQLSVSCFINGAKGNGEVVMTKRDVPTDFIKIDASAGVNVILDIADQTSVRVETDENLQELITTKVKNGVLYVGAKGFIRRATAKNVYVSLPGINGLTVQSGASIKGEDRVSSKGLELKASSGGSLSLLISADEVNTKASSGGNIHLSGECDLLVADVSSGGNIKANQLEAERCDASASSGGNMNVNVKEDLNSSTSSGGRINNNRAEQDWENAVSTN